MNQERIEQKGEGNFGANELGQVQFVPVETVMRGLVIHRKPEQTVVIGDINSGSFLQIDFLFCNDTKEGRGVTIATRLIKSHTELSSQQHTLKIAKTYQLEGTAIYLTLAVNLFEDQGSVADFILDVPRHIPIVRGELVQEHQ